MVEVRKVASYIANRYKKEYGVVIDEMKLHKLLYFVQRESLIQIGKPLFSESFYGWKYGPVLKTIRDLYKSGSLNESLSETQEKELKPIMDKVFSQYATRNAISLSRLSHGELSWKNARIGLKPWEQGDRSMDISDIKKDAMRIKLRRAMLSGVA